MIIRTKVPGFTGIRAGVPFCAGEGHTDDPHLINWFKTHGYTVIDEAVNAPEPEPEIEPELSLDDMSLDQLKEWMKSIGKGGYIGNIKDRDKLLEKAKTFAEELETNETENETEKE